MALAAMMDRWDRTCLIWATIANAHRDTKKKSKPFHPNEAHPLAKLKPKEQALPIKEAIRRYGSTQPS